MATTADGFAEVLAASAGADADDAFGERLIGVALRRPARTTAFCAAPLAAFVVVVVFTGLGFLAVLATALDFLAGFTLAGCERIGFGDAAERCGACFASIGICDDVAITDELTAS